VTLLLRGPDADLGDELAAGLHGACPLDLPAFEAAFVALVEASGPTRDLAWDAFYDATLARVAAGWAQDEPGESTVEVFTRIWSRAAALAVGRSVLDVGTCFGWLPLAWSARPGAPRLLAVDLAPASAVLAARQAARRGAPVTVLQADGARLPLRDRATDTVLLLHVLEHLEVARADAVLAEALRVAARRVVVAVPVEPVADPLFGHVQVYDLPRLADLGLASGWTASVSDADGAWLVLDRPPGA
jgi:SAM-dependent methyltransferase